MNSNTIFFLLIIIYFIIILIIEIFFTDMNIYTVGTTLIFLLIVIFYFWFLKTKKNKYSKLEELNSEQIDTTPFITSNMVCRKIRS